MKTKQTMKWLARETKWLARGKAKKAKPWSMPPRPPPTAQESQAAQGSA
jgi:hypothetical protein